MKKFVLIALLAGISSTALADGFAGHVVSYDAGAGPAIRYYFDGPNFMGTAALDNPAVALGKPSLFVTDPYAPDSIVSPFSPAANPDQIVSIGEGGSLTLELENYAVVGAGADIGLFTNVGVWTYNGDSGTFGVDVVTVDVSYDGAAWVSLGPITVDVPTDAWVDASDPYSTSTAGLTEADFSKPFGGLLADLIAKTYAEIKTSFDGSAGGHWLDLSGTGLTEVGFIRFSVPDDGDTETFLNFELDAVSIASGHVGAQLPEPCTMSLLALAGVGLLRRRRK